MNSLIPWKRTESQRRNNGVLQATPISAMRWDWDNLFDRIVEDVWGSDTRSMQGIVLDFSETDEEIRIRAEVPGMRPKDLDISLSGDVLTLSGEKVDEDAPAQGARHYSERQFGTYQRAIKLPCAVDADKVRAEHRDGVVTITLQKAEAVRPKRIEVKAS